MLYDKNIREPLFDYLEDTYGKCRIFEEKVMGKARADVVLLLPDEIIGIEIKSNVDTYERLKGQVRNYNRYCDRNFIITGLRHIKHVGEHVPPDWGILCIYEDHHKILIEPIRDAAPNPKCKKEVQLSWAWRMELDQLIEYNHLPKYRQKSKAFVVQKLLEKVPWPLLKSQFCQELFERDYTLWTDEE